MNKMFVKKWGIVFIIVCVFLIASCSGVRDLNSSDRQSLLSSQIDESNEDLVPIQDSLRLRDPYRKDLSGSIETMIIHSSSFSSSFYNSRPSKTIKIPDNSWVVIGGGALVTPRRSGGAGMLLVSSYPNDDLSSWTVVGKDHLQEDRGKITAFAILMRVKGMDRDELLSHIKLTKQTSGFEDHPSTIAKLPGQYSLLGGGFKVENEVGVGIMVVDSYPDGVGWKVESKDHIKPDYGTITSYAIGIETVIKGFGSFSTDINSSATTSREHVPKATSPVDDGYVLVGGGADTHYYGVGSMLWSNRPDYSGWIASAKDHLKSDKGNITTYSIGLKAELSESYDHPDIMTDESGKISILIIKEESKLEGQHSVTMFIPKWMQEDWVMISAGGYLETEGQGSFLHSSVPLEDSLFGWIVSGKDHLNSSPSVLHSYAIMMKIEGLRRKDLIKYIHVARSTSASSHTPNKIVELSDDYIVLGGGYSIGKIGIGNYIVDSHPEGNGWRAQSKDHLKSDPAIINTYAIGIKKYIPGVGNLVTEINKVSSTLAHAPEARLGTSAGFVLVGGGADSELFSPYRNSSGYGSMLNACYPDKTGEWVSRASDHLRSDRSWLKTYSIGLKVQN
jgi:hypothetical protein